MTIERIEIRNFQKHKRLVIDLDPFVTVICGESDAGKSSILRALRWVCLNRPTGESFVRFEAVGRKQKACSVLVRADGGQSVKRLKQAKPLAKSSYHLGDEVFTAFGASVPDSIGNFLNISDLNFARQHDPPFWFGLSAGEVSRELNQIVNLSLIDSTLATAASEIRQAKTTVEVSEDRLKAAQQELEESAFAKEMDADLREIEALQEQIDDKASRIAQDERFLKQWTEALERKKIVSERCFDASEGMAEIEAIREKLEAVSERLEQAEQLSTKWEEACRRKARSAKLLENLKAKLSKIMGEICPLCGQKVTSSLCLSQTCT